MEATPIKVGTLDLRVTEASLDVGEKVALGLEALRTGPNSAGPRRIAEIIVAVVADNHPDLTVEQVMKAISMRTAIKALDAVLAAAKLKEEEAPGEAQSPSP
jgi:hypothetical protein